MNLKDMECFIEVCDKKSISSAAESLFLSPQAVSKSVKRMEEEIGASLLFRSQKGVVLTEYGKIFYDQARKIVKEYRDVLLEITDLKKQNNGFLRLVSAFGILRLLSPEFVHAFFEKYPTLRLDYMEYPDAYIEENVKNKKYDVGFVPYIREDPELEYIPLFSREIFFITHDRSKFYNCEEVSVRSISEEPIIIENANFRIHQIMEETCRKEGVKLDVYFNTSGFSLCYKLCKEHEGNSASMDFIFQDMKREGLHMIPFKEHPKWNVAAVRRKDMPRTENVEKLLQFSEEWCRTL